MSHVTRVGGVKIKDVAAMKSAVQELVKKGVRCELVENQVPRMHGEAEHRRVGKCEYVLKLHSGSYDVGFKKQTDGTYEAVIDTYGSHVGKQIGAACPMPNTAEGRAQHQMGQFMQQYTRHAVINAERAKGRMVEDCIIDAQGKMHLTISGYN